MNDIEFIDEAPQMTHYQCEFCGEMYLDYEACEGPKICVDCYCEFEAVQEYFEQARRDAE